MSQNGRGWSADARVTVPDASVAPVAPVVTQLGALWFAQYDHPPCPGEKWAAAGEDGAGGYSDTEARLLIQEIDAPDWPRAWRELLQTKGEIPGASGP